MEAATSSVEVLVCQTCGDEGFANAFIYCVKCLGFVIHRYCLDVLPDTLDEFVFWVCDDCKSPVSYHFTLPSTHNSFDKEDRQNSAFVSAPSHLKKKRTKKLRSLVAAMKDTECVSGPNQITPCVVIGLPKHVPLPAETVEQKKPLKKKVKKKGKRVPLKETDDKRVEEPPNGVLQEALARSDSGANQITLQSAELDNNCSPVAEQTKKHKTENANEHSSCESSCTDAMLRKEEDMTHSEEGPRGGECGPVHDKLVSDSSCVEKELENRSKEVNGSDYASQSAYLETNIQEMYYQPARPVVDPVWRGRFTITQTDYGEIGGLYGHLSSKACHKVCEEATTLSSKLTLEMHSKAHLWPKSFLDSMPSDENIALYFFPGGRSREFEQLVNDMIDGDLAMKTTAKNAELLMFTSKVLPQPYQRFQGHYYLWGVFRNKRNDVPVSNHNDISGNKVASEKQTVTRLKAIESHSPQSPLCDYR